MIGMLAAATVLVGVAGWAAPLQPQPLAGPLPAPLPASPALLAEPWPVPGGWRVKGLDGRLRALSSWRGRVVVLNMWASWCAPCLGEMESFRALRDGLRAEGVDEDRLSLLLLTPEPLARVQRFARRRLPDMPVFVEHDPLPPAFGLRAVPTTWILDREGRVVLAHRGAADWNTPRVRELLLGLASHPGVAAPAGAAGR